MDQGIFVIFCFHQALIYDDSAQAYHIKPWKTKSRSLLVVTANLVLILFSLDVLLLALLPQYATFSSQKYAVCDGNASFPYPPLPTPLPDSTAIGEDSGVPMSTSLDDECQKTLILPCDWNAPEGQCIMTRIAVLWTRVSYKTWYFGAAYYCITWIFLAFVVLEGCIATFRPSHTATSERTRPVNV